MSELADDAIVLDAVPYRDRHQILSVLTASFGVVRGVFRGARGGKSPGASATQVLSRVHVTVWRAPHAELATFRAVDLVRPSFGLAATVERSAAAAVAAELALTFCPPAEPAPRHFRLLDAVTEALLAGREPSALVAYTELWMLALGGVLPSLDRCTGCGAPLRGGFRAGPEDGHPLCGACAPPSSTAIPAAAHAFLQACRRDPPGAVAGRPAPRRASAWLDRLVPAEADRPLRALAFFRRLAGPRRPPAGG